jgi:hypothetical protein
MPTNEAARLQWLSDLQDDAVAALGSRDTAAVVDLLSTLQSASGTAPLKAAAIELLTPSGLGGPDLFGSLLKVFVSGLQVRLDSGPWRDVASFLAGELDPQNPRTIETILGLNRVLQADNGRVILALLRNALNEAPPEAGLAPGESPAEVLVSILSDLEAAGQTSVSAVAPLDSLTGFLEDVVVFIRDDEDGLEWIFDLIRARSGGPGL